jgi:hypothetical protein
MPADEIVQRLRDAHHFRFTGDPYGMDAPSLYTDAADEIEHLRAVLTEILHQTAWVDSHPGEPCKRMLNAVNVATWERWRAALFGSTEGVDR